MTRMGTVATSVAKGRRVGARGVSCTRSILLLPRPTQLLVVMLLFLLSASFDACCDGLQVPSFPPSRYHRGGTGTTASVVVAPLSRRRSRFHARGSAFGPVSAVVPALDSLAGLLTGTASAAAPTHHTGHAAGHVAAPHLLRGRLSKTVAKFLVSPGRMWEIFVVLMKHAAQDWNDWLLITLCIRAPMPLAYRWYQFRYRDFGLAEAPLKQKFRFSKTRKIAEVITEVGRLLAFLFTTELFFLFLKELGFKFVNAAVHTWAAGVVAALWAAKTLSELKRYLLTRANRKDLSKANGARLLNRFLDILIWVATGLSILDFLSIKTGMAMRSLLGLSSVGTLVFSLSAQSLVSEFLASLAIQGTNMYTEGEWIVLGDGSQIKGEVQKLGWLNTLIRGNDEMVLRIPNTQIARTRIANVSRQRLSNVQVTLDISYTEIGKLKQLVDDIRSNLLDTLDVYATLITDNSRPFRVHWREVTETSLVVVVDTHLRVKPFSDEYWNTRQEIFFAIARAAEKNDIKFAYKDRFRLRGKEEGGSSASSSSAAALLPRQATDQNGDDEENNGLESTMEDTSPPQAFSGDKKNGYRGLN